MDLTTKDTSISQTLARHNISSMDEVNAICDKAGIDVFKIVKSIQPICFDNAVKAYKIGVAIALNLRIKPMTYAPVSCYTLFFMELKS